MSDAVADLYDYGELRSLDQATMFAVSIVRPALVLGGSQSVQVLGPDKLGATDVRRRRGGGGLVYLQPDDLWIDWWIPVDDSRWLHDVRASSIQVGQWWAEVLGSRTTAPVSVHEGPLEGAEAHRLACFAGRGPGEVFVDGRKAVGVTQWRVREGSFLSTVMHRHDSLKIIDFLAEPPRGLREALDHQSADGLGIDGREEVTAALRDVSGPWRFRDLLL